MGLRMDIVDAMPRTMTSAEGMTPMELATEITMGINSVTVTTLDINWVMMVVNRKITTVIKYTLVDPPIRVIKRSAICWAAPVFFKAVASGVIPPKRMTVLMLTS